MAECLKLRLLLKIADCWSVDEAVWVFNAFCSEKDDVFYWNNFITDVETLQAANHGMASSVLLVFSGGPLGKIREYQGSFAMFVVDRVLVSGKDWDWLLRFNRDTTTHIRDQNLMPRLGGKPSFTTGEYDYCEDGQPSEFIEIQGELFPLNREGRQVSQTCCEPEKTDDGIVRRWTSSGSVVVRERNNGKLD